MPFRRAALAVLVCLPLVLTACTSSGSSSSPSSTDTMSAAPLSLPPATRAASQIPDLPGLRSALAAMWVRNRDAISGATFELPRIVTAKAQTTDGLAQRLYTVAPSNGLAVSVAVSTGASAAAVQSLLGSYLGVVAQQFQTNGATDAKIVGQASGTVAGHPSVSGRLVFTPGTVPTVPVVWYIDAVAYGTYLVVAQTITFPPTTDPSYLTICAALQKRLVSGLKLP